MLSQRLKDKMVGLKSQPPIWEKPVGYDMSATADQTAVEELIDSGRVTTIYDPAPLIADDLYGVLHPDAMDNDSQRREFVDDLMTKEEGFGRWFYFADNSTLVCYPEHQDHFNLRTARNRNLVNEEEQRTIGSATIAVYGLSVGRSIVEGLVLSGIGGKYILGDPDKITPTNLNRIHSSMENVGSPKIDDLAWTISRVDPYIEQVHDRLGYTTASNELLDTHRPDLVVEEVDDLAAKALLRAYAASSRTPLMMVTDLGKKSIIDMEMHNIELVPPFLGRISEELNQALMGGKYTEQQRRQAMSQIVGVRNLSPRIIQSFMDVGVRTAGAPQLRRTVSLGASLAIEGAEEILLGRVRKSMSRVVPLSGILGGKSRDGLRADMGTWWEFLRYMRYSSQHNK